MNRYPLPIALLCVSAAVHIDAMAVDSNQAKDLHRNTCLCCCYIDQQQITPLSSSPPVSWLACDAGQQLYKPEQRDPKKKINRQENLAALRAEVTQGWDPHSDLGPGMFVVILDHMERVSTRLDDVRPQMQDLFALTQVHCRTNLRPQCAVIWHHEPKQPVDHSISPQLSKLHRFDQVRDVNYTVDSMTESYR